MHRSVLILCFLVGATSLNAQVKSYLSLELQAFLKTANPEEFTDLFLRGDVDQLANYVEENGGKVKFAFENIISATIPNSSINGLNNLNGLEYVEFSRSKPQVLNDMMLVNNNVIPIHAGAAPLSHGYTGTDVIMGFVDTGIELEHPDFQDADGNSRVLYIWDQTQDEVDASKIPEYGYGQAYNHEDILQNINVHEDQGVGHGSTVAGTGAGNGMAINNYKGVAPDANIIMVSSDFDRNNWKSSVADAVDFIYQRAQELNKPAVVNLSLGDYYGSHDGLDAAALYIDQLLESTNGFSVVSAAGNSGEFEDYHLSYEIPASDTTFTWFAYNPDVFTDEGAVYFEMWVDQDSFEQSRFALGVDANTPNWNFLGYSNWRSASENVNVVVKDTVFNNDQIMGIVETWVGERGNQYEIEVKVSQVFNTQYPWRLAMTGGGVFDCWSYADFGTSEILYQDLPSTAEYPAMEWYQYPDNHKTIVDSWNCSDKVITVGNYSNRSSFINYTGGITTIPVVPGEIATSSSRGPTRDNRPKPTIAATGGSTISCGKISTLNSWITSNPTSVAEGGWHIINGGTSMASPVVAGTAALYYQCNPNANYQDIIDAVVQNAFADQYTGQLPGLQFGNGKLNAYAVLVECEELLSTNNYGNSSDFKVFPNPTSNLITIRTDASLITAEIYDMSGKRIQIQQLSNGDKTAQDQYQINLKELSSGLYLLKAIQSNGSYNTSRVLIKK